MVIVGLGNIGKEYENTHHNAGFMAIDQVAKANNLTFLLEKKFQAYICEYFFEGKKNYLVKPITYMNNSGIAVKAIMDYYNLSEKELVVIYDDLDLPLGQIRIRESGSAGTHNGMKSIVNMLGTKNFARIRIGIAKQKEVDTIDYVLSKFSKKEMEKVNESLIKFPNMIDDLLRNGITYIMNHYNGSDK